MELFTTIFHFTDILFQIHLGGVDACSNITVKKTASYIILLSILFSTFSIPQISSKDQNLMLDSITNTVLEVLKNSCSDCGITNDLIDEQKFSCFSESPTYVTYRARLEGTSETDSGSLISLIEEWVSGGASIIVTGVLMTVDSECSVAISSLSEGECLTSDNTMIIIAVAVAAIVGIMVIAIIVVIVVYSSI